MWYNWSINQRARAKKGCEALIWKEMSYNADATFSSPYEEENNSKVNIQQYLDEFDDIENENDEEEEDC